MKLPKDPNFRGLFRHRGVSMLIVGATFAVLAQSAYLANVAVSDVKHNQELQTKKIIEQTEKIISLHTEIKDVQERSISIQKQSNETQQLILCLLQAQQGGNFTDRAECQRRLEQAVSSGLFGGRVQQQVQGIAGPQGQPGQNGSNGNDGTINGLLNGLGKKLGLQ